MYIVTDNKAPVFQTDTNINIEGASDTVQLAATDAEGHSMSFRLVADGGADCVSVSSAGLMSFSGCTLTTEASFPVTVEVSDQCSGNTTKEFTVNVLEEGPHHGGSTWVIPVVVTICAVVVVVIAVVLGVKCYQKKKSVKFCIVTLYVCHIYYQ